MFRMRALVALTLPITGVTALPVAVSAQQPLSETQAVELTLLREGYAALDEAERAAASAEVAAVRRFDNPTIEVEHENVGDETEWTVGVVQPLDISGRRGALRDAARADAAATDADVAYRRVRLIAEVRGTYARCAAASSEMMVRRSFVDQLAEAERSVTARADAGDTAVYDVRRVRVAARAADAELAIASGERAAQCSRLATLTGTPGAVAQPGSTRPAMGVPAATRDDLVALEQRVLAESQRVRAARAARIPEIAIGAGARRISDPTGSATGPIVSLGVTLPLFSNGRAEVDVATARRRAAEAQLVIARREVEAQRAEAAARLLSAREAEAAATRASDDASRLGAIAITAYQSGETGVVELVDAFEAARDAELSVIALSLAAAEAAIANDLANGGPNP